MPAIYVKNIRNFSEFHKKWIHLTGINDFSCKSTPSYLIIRANSHPVFAIISKYLISTSAEFHTFRPYYMRHFKVIIQNLHHTTTLSDISDALAEYEYSVVRVVNIRKNQCPLPLFHVELTLKNNNHDIFNISTLLHSIVVIEKRHSKINDPPQCFKSQAYGHTHNYSCHSPRCVKCGDDYLTANCTKDRSLPTKCSLCSSDHTASYKGCPILKKLRYVFLAPQCWKIHNFFHAINCTIISTNLYQRISHGKIDFSLGVPGKHFPGTLNHT
jgi:hypothetical protein